LFVAFEDVEFEELVEPEASALPPALTFGETEFAVSLALLRAPLAVASPLDAAPLARESAEDPVPAAVPARPDVFALPDAEPFPETLAALELALAEPPPVTEPALFRTPLA
jgi:hypothetical protein